MKTFFGVAERPSVTLLEEQPQHPSNNTEYEQVPPTIQLEEQEDERSPSRSSHHCKVSGQT